MSGGSMYKELVEKLRKCSKDSDTYKNTLFREAADAIEGLEENIEIMDTILNIFTVEAKPVTDTNVGCKWIPVETRLSGDHEKVLTCDAYGNIHVDCHYRGFKYPFCIYPNDAKRYMPIAWMPLPEPYRKE